MLSSFSSCYDQSEEQSVQTLLRTLDWPPERAGHVQKTASGFISHIRSRKKTGGQLESFLQKYALTTTEGLALMGLAEALLRIPDKHNQNALIREKIAAAHWLNDGHTDEDWKVRTAGLGLFLTQKTLGGLFSKIGEPVIRETMVKAMQFLGQQFILGQTVSEALKNAAGLEQNGYRLSYDVLGEGARTFADADHYFQSYYKAIESLGTHIPQKTAGRPGISVKLSALHPRYQAFQADHCVPEITARLKILALRAKDFDIPLTVDAEETERLDLSVQIMEYILRDTGLKDWDGFGCAVQAYHKAAPALIDLFAGLTVSLKRRMQIRLVKGAYWDSEIKKAQSAGLQHFPVYTRKCHTDLAYLACAQQLLTAQDTLYPMFATHNAHSMAAILEMTRHTQNRFEFQKLFGMGQALHDHALEKERCAISVYAPIGSHRDLLPYLVRRLLENGANTSFVNQIMNPDASVESLVVDPVDNSQKTGGRVHSQIALPSALFTHEHPVSRTNAQGLNLHAPDVITTLQARMAPFFRKTYQARCIINGESHKTVTPTVILNPGHRHDVIGQAYSATPALVLKAFEAATGGFDTWNRTDAQVRASHLERFADLLEHHNAELMALCIREAGKTLPDALSELREAVDFCRYYAGQGRSVFHPAGTHLPGVTGESNTLFLKGRGVFVCISPWNFPMAIFTGQIVAALMAGNAVIAKPAEQTPLIAGRIVALMYEAGIPPSALHLVIGDGTVGADLVRHENVAGLVFTGSTTVAQHINRTLAEKTGPIVPLIAETGGQNGMIVDSTALPEQVVDDVMLSAFGAAGQRCSALRILCVQEEIAERVINLLKGAMETIRIENQALISSDLGPVIDQEAYDALMRHTETMMTRGRLLARVPVSETLSQQGYYFGPCAFEISSIKILEKEIFGPVLHVVRYKKEHLDTLLRDISDMRYGLTLGIHSRLNAFHQRVIQGIPAGNVYINRSMIGAVVGSQPFGGSGLSGTGPKAGGPHYLARFATETVVTNNIAAIGGNASLVSLTE